jgi:F-type H+-transporting ATPase subunit a
VTTLLGLPRDSRGPFPAPTADEFFFDPIDLFGTKLDWHVAGLDLSVNRVVLLEFLAMAVAMALFAFAFRRPRPVPGNLQGGVEAVMEFIRTDVVEGTLGAKGRKYTPYLLALFFFIWIGNLFEVIPGISFPVNSRTGLPAALAIITLILFIREGVRHAGAWGYLKETLFPPGVPKPVYLILTPIELISTFVIRPMTLCIRLAANMIAGHLLLSIMYLATDYLLFGYHYDKAFTAIFAAGSFLGAIVFTGFELFVGTLQAYIFTLLTAVYLASSMEPQH